MRFEETIYILPTWSIPAIIYDDWTGLSNKQDKALSEFLSDIPAGSWEVSSESEFHCRNNLSDLGDDCYECKLYWVKPHQNKCTRCEKINPFAFYAPHAIDDSESICVCSDCAESIGAIDKDGQIKEGLTL